jgi:hypothetical protein
MGLFKPRWKSDDLKVALAAVEKLDYDKQLLRVIQEAPRWEIKAAAVKKLTSPFKLMEIAEHHQDSFVRIAAAEMMVDKQLAQSIFAEIAQSDDAAKESAFEKLNDQVQLAEVAQFSLDKNIAEGAVKKVTRHDLVVTIAQNSQHERVRLLANERWKNQDFDRQQEAKRAQEESSENSKNAQFNSVASADAVKHINNQEWLTDLALNATDDKIRMAAAHKLENREAAQELYCHIALTTKDNDICEKATALITNQKLLVRIFLSIRPERWDYSLDRREKNPMFFSLSDRLNDHAAFAEAIIDNQEMTPYYRPHISLLTDRALLKDIAQHAYCASARIIAMELLDDQTLTQEVYADIAQNGAKDRGLDDYYRFEAIKKLGDEQVAQKAYAHLAITPSSSDYWQYSIKKLTDQALLLDVARHSNYPFARKEAVKRITDRQVLTQFAEGKEEYFFEWAVDRGYDNMEICTVDLRDEATRRLAELNEKVDPHLY